jgi:glutamate--cysteine ligase
VVAIAERGLKRRAVFDRDGQDERKHLARLAETAAEGRSPADRLLDDYAGKWRGDIEKLFDTQAL